MKVVILCGGRGARLGEHGAQVPKALIEIGGRPILWHLLKIYSHQGFNQFILCLGHLGEEIRRYFRDTREHESWQVTMVDTGLDTNTGGRIHRVKPHLDGEESFCVTYGDGLADIDLRALIDFHRSHGRIATLTAVQPRSPFGLLQLDPAGAVTAFAEKPTLKEWINGGFFVFEHCVFDYLTGDSILEQSPLERLAREGQLMAYRHTGFWKCMDTYKDNIELNQLWDSGAAPWKIW
ncbi:MAG TPA: glucose-1-phosphate cytidylyltransferase [Candidatus Xenobia bacterium]|nr:glucose-1-phosphate cytidylyltransferase [Candidatus Xenobia bacterium]